MEDPGYHHLLDLVTALGLRTVPVAVDDQGMRREALRDALRAGVRAVVCSPRAQNPYGGRFSAERRDSLVAILQEEPDVLVVENDHASAVADAPLHALAAGGLERWVHVRTVSKFLRDGPAVGGCGLRSDHAHRRDGRMLLASGWVSHLLQETVYELMTDDDTRWSHTGHVRAAAERTATPTRGTGDPVPFRERTECLGTGARRVGRRQRAAVLRVVGRGGCAVQARFRAPGVWISVAELDPSDAAHLASDFAVVLGESEATYGG